MTVNKENMKTSVTKDFSNATELADYLAAKGMPFREAHEVVGKLVLHCIQKGCYLADLSFVEYKQSSSLFEVDIYDALNPYNAVVRRNSAGGTGFAEVSAQINKGKLLIETDKL